MSEGHRTLEAVAETTRHNDVDLSVHYDCSPRDDWNYMIEGRFPFRHGGQTIVAVATRATKSIVTVMRSLLKARPGITHPTTKISWDSTEQ